MVTLASKVILTLKDSKMANNSTGCCDIIGKRYNKYAHSFDGFLMLEKRFRQVHSAI